MRANDFISRALDVLALAAACFLLCPEGAFELFISLSLHEAAHLAALRLCGVRSFDMSVSPLGLRIKYACAILPRRARIAAALSGAAANLTLAAVGFFLGALLFSSINLVLALFNLLPIEGLDGGEALAAILSNRENDPANAVKIISCVSAAALWSFSVYVQLRAALAPEILVVSSALLIKELIS